MSEQVDWAAAAAEQRIDPAWIDDIFEFLRIPSISASEEHAGEVLRAGTWLRDHIRAGGGRAELVQTKRQPLVVGHVDATAADPATAPSVLVYAHFDVQPPGEPELWDSPAFEPAIRDGWIYARGATDDKIHLYILVRAALDLAAEGRLPVNVRIVSDGEEETLGDTIVDWLREDTERIDLALAFDGLMQRPGQIVFTVSTRGLCLYRIDVETGTEDLHSGMFGGVGLNAIDVLNEMLAAVVCCPDELAVGSLELTAERAAEWDAAEDWAAILAQAGGRPISDAVMADYNRITAFRPSVDVNGVAAGEAGLIQTIIPARAQASVSLRLAPGQEVAQVCPIFERLLRDAAHPNATVEITQLAANPGSHTNPDLPVLKRIGEAFGRVLGSAPTTLPWGASVPLMAALDERGIPNILTGFGLPDSAFHAPNERFPLAYVPLGIEAVRESLIALRADG